uniref:Uncharacterized protein LOC111127840 isoform X2 n=1 Tax=Crassostrea virginica TaxID=6565 RepID=A0A8B8DPA5_CRAVI|nr:uncharacterized protein LOC111127840 isoform X2 [Crassostrea virginica]
MADNAGFRASQQEIHPPDESIHLIKELICIKTGHPPVNADHIYSLEQHLDAFVHPCPTIRNIPGGTLPTASSNIRANLQGWNEMNQIQRAQVDNLFENTPEDHLKLAYDQFIKKFGRAPFGVLEFYRFFLTFEVDLYLENERLRSQQLEMRKTIDYVRRMQSLLHSRIEALEVSQAASKQREAFLQNQKQELFEHLSNIQEEKEKLQQDHNTLQQEQARCLAELEDERKDKQMYMYQARRQEFPERGSSTRNASHAPRGRGSGGGSRPPEALGYLEQNPAI